MLLILSIVNVIGVITLTFWQSEPIHYLLFAKDGWITAVTSFSTVFLSYQEDWSVIVTGRVQWNPIYE